MPHSVPNDASLCIPKHSLSWTLYIFFYVLILRTFITIELAY